MEGSKRSIKGSLRFRLIIIFCTLGVITTFFASFQSYNIIKREAIEFVDEELAQMAAIVINYNMALPGRWEGPRHSHEKQFRSHKRLFSRHNNNAKLNPLTNNINTSHSHNYDIIIAPLYGRPGDEIFIPTGVSNGFYNIIVSNKRMRMIVATKNDGRRFVIARPMSAVNGISSKAFYTSLVQFLIISILYIPLVIASVNLMFKAIYKIAKRIDGRQHDDLSDIIKKDDGFIPTELNSFIGAINGLFHRVDESIANQRRFIADAAHEMRTPLTALSLQAEALESENLPKSARDKLKILRTGITRERDLMTSLLTLAKTQDKAGAVDFIDISVSDLFIKLVEDLAPLADDKNIDFGVEGSINYTLRSSLPDILCIMSNLTSNAIKYAKENGRVDLMCKEYDDRFDLIVKDDGPGIKDEFIKKVFEPFYRVDGDRQSVVGTGLGLSIALASSLRIGAKITLVNAKEGGLEAILSIKK